MQQDNLIMGPERYVPEAKPREYMWEQGLLHVLGDSMSTDLIPPAIYDRAEQDRANCLRLI